VNYLVFGVINVVNSIWYVLPDSGYFVYDSYLIFLDNGVITPNNWNISFQSNSNFQFLKSKNGGVILDGVNIRADGVKTDQACLFTLSSGYSIISD
jgi:hypothetical protein